MGVAFDKAPPVPDGGGLCEKAELVWARVKNCFAGCWWPPPGDDCEGRLPDEAMLGRSGWVLSMKGLRDFGESITAVYVPDSVGFLSSRCFYGCTRLRWFAFGAASRLRGIGAAAFYGCDIREIAVPNGVVELGERCFLRCSKLASVWFGGMSCLRRIGERAFAGDLKDGCPITEIKPWRGL